MLFIIQSDYKSITLTEEITNFQRKQELLNLVEKQLKKLGAIQ